VVATADDAESVRPYSRFGGLMGKTLVIVIAVLLCWGCGRGSATAPDDVRSTTQAPGTLVSSFDEEPCVLTGSNVIRVGWYFDFSAYDSLVVTFNAARLSPERPFDEIIVKIGPATCLRDTLYATQEAVSLTVRVSDLGKPGNCALTFRAPDPLTLLRLSGLRVVGWKSI
jgi:hypothetical protein